MIGICLYLFQNDFESTVYHVFPGWHCEHVFRTSEMIWVECVVGYSAWRTVCNFCDAGGDVSVDVVEECTFSDGL